MNPQDIRPFVPSKDFDKSIVFYSSLGFSVDPAGDELALVTKGSCTFFLYKCSEDEIHGESMNQLIVPSIQDAFEIISKIDPDLGKHSEIKNERWGKVILLWGPSGELWHVTELTN